MTPNIADAKDQLYNCVKNFHYYSGAYITTNEYLRETLELLPGGANNALTVAGSGDHPMFTMLYTAKHVDTFDLSFNAKVIMDIKTAALQLLNHEEYRQLLKDLAAAHNRFQPFCSVDNMQKIIPNLTKFEQEYIQKLSTHKLFISDSCDDMSLPTEQEFLQMRNVIKKPFSFIWSDITNLHAHLTKKYDFIHLSNIFDYMPHEGCMNALFSLAKHTNPGCNICFVWFRNNKVKEVLLDFLDLDSMTESPQLWTFGELPKHTLFLHRMR